jgi:DNA-binding LytR/AlgR family response regulator
MHILITDDETPARFELRYILETFVPEATFYEATNGEEALQLIERNPIDVAFLDIRMPDLDGLTVAATIMEGPEPPLIVFATAYDEHALQTFELAALDYVMKRSSAKVAQNFPVSQGKMRNYASFLCYFCGIAMKPFDEQRLAQIVASFSRRIRGKRGWL